MTSCKPLASIHDWSSAVSSSIRDGTPPALEEWLQGNVCGTFTPLCLESLAGFMREHPALYIVTDVKDHNVAAVGIIAENCPDLMDRFIIQICQDREYNEIAALGFRHIIYTLYNLPPADKRDTKSLSEFAADHPLLGCTCPKELRRVWRYTKRMKEIGVKLFVHNDKKANKSEPASNVATEPTLKQDMNETRINQLVQTASDLKITAKSVPMEVRLANNGQYSYEYNKDEYAVTTTANGSTFEAAVHLHAPFPGCRISFLFHENAL